MYALPKQTLCEAQADLQEAMSFDVSHLSLYHLTLEPNTYFASHPPQLPHDDESDAMFESALETLAAHGFGRH